MKLLQPGVNEGFTNSEYHADKSWLSSSQLKLVLKDPAKFYNDVILGNADALEGSYLDIGSCVHTLILEPHMLLEDFAIAHDCFQRRGKAWQAFVEANEGNGKTLLSASMYEQAQLYAASVKARPEALDKLKNGRPELSVCRVVNGVPVKVRADFIAPGAYINDVKTTSSPAGLSYFKEAVRDYGYDFSMGMYSEVCDLHFGASHDFYWTVISKEDHQADLYKAAASTMERCKAQFYAALELYKACKASGVWQLPTVDGKEPSQAYKVEEL